MKLGITLLCLGLATPALAAKYDCELTGSLGKPKFSIDTAIEDMKSAPLPSSGSIGCLVFRSSSPLLTCYLNYGNPVTISSTAELGSAVLSLSVTATDIGTNTLACVKKTAD